nr:hypothetical protein [Microbacterium sp. SORGH_AS_0505]
MNSTERHEFDLRCVRLVVRHHNRNPKSETLGEAEARISRGQRAYSAGIELLKIIGVRDAPVERHSILDAKFACQPPKAIRVDTVAHDVQTQSSLAEHGIRERLDRKVNFLACYKTTDIDRSWRSSIYLIESNGSHVITPVQRVRRNPYRLSRDFFARGRNAVVTVKDSAVCKRSHPTPNSRRTGLASRARMEMPPKESPATPTASSQ